MLEPTEVAIVCQLAEAFIASGGRFKTTAAALNAKELRTRRGASWTDMAIARVLLHESFKDLVPEDVWNGCRAFLAERRELGARPARRAVHPLGSVVNCTCGGRMYLRGSGPTGRFACRTCRANKLPRETLERLFQESLASIEMTGDEILEGFRDSPRVAELSRMLGNRAVTLSEVWPALETPERLQLVDLLVSRIVVDRDEISVLLTFSGHSGPESAPSQAHPLPTLIGLATAGEKATNAGMVTVPTDTPSPDPTHLPMLLSVEDAARVLRTTRKAVYAMADRAQLPGATRVGRRLLVRRDDLLRSLAESRAPSLEGKR